MVIEVAHIDIAEGSEEAFEAAFTTAESRLTGAAGLVSASMFRCVETPSRYMLIVEWESVDAHEAFRGTPAFTEWRTVVGPHFAGPPSALHYAAVETESA